MIQKDLELLQGHNNGKGWVGASSSTILRIWFSYLFTAFVDLFIFFGITLGKFTFGELLTF